MSIQPISSTTVSLSGKEKYTDKGNSYKSSSIAKDSDFAYSYAIDVIKGPWPPGEAAIAKSPQRKKSYEKLTGVKL